MVRPASKTSTATLTGSGRFSTRWSALGVLRVTDALRHRYSLRSSNVLGLLGTVEDVENKLLAERQLRRVLDTDVVRRSLPARTRESEGASNCRTPSPAAYAATGSTDLRPHPALAKRSRNAVVLVCGLGAAGLEHLAGFLDDGYGEAAIQRADLFASANS